MECLTRRKNLASIAYLLGGASLAAAQSHKPSDQPEMRTALEHLREAKANLEKASHDKGGHRVHALDLVNQAITEVTAGMQYAIHHP